MAQEEEEYAQEPGHPMPGDDDDDNEEEEEEEKKSSLDKPKIKISSASKTCSILAHNKMVLHALKHLHRPIFGLLIGNTFRDNSSQITYCHIMDIIPLQHNIYSSMVIEIAFLQIQQYFKQLNKEKKDNKDSNLQILGVYFSNFHIDDVSKNISAMIIASQLIKEYSNENIFLCQVISDRIKMSYKGEDTSLDWYQLKNKNDDPLNKRDWKDIEDIYLVKTDKPNIKIKDNEFNEDKYENWLINTSQFLSLNNQQKFKQLNLKKLLSNKAEEKIYDFDDHLDDQSKDWRNLQIFNL